MMRERLFLGAADVSAAIRLRLATQTAQDAAAATRATDGVTRYVSEFGSQDELRYPDSGGVRDREDAGGGREARAEG